MHTYIHAYLRPSRKSSTAAPTDSVMSPIINAKATRPVTDVMSATVRSVGASTFAYTYRHIYMYHMHTCIHIYTHTCMHAYKNI